MKEWPEDNKPARFSDLCDEVVSAIRFAYDMERKNKGEDIPLTGPDAPESANITQGSYLLTAEQLKISEENHGRDALTEIVGFALRLGMEQGRRITLDGDEFKTLNMKVKIIKHILNQ